MKKNITINLFGQLYNIDEDAFELLDKYQKNMRAYFSHQEGGDEIADDIENRVAELFSELKQNGTNAITIEHVQQIIHQIGNPEELSDSEEEQGQATPPPYNPNTQYGRRRLFRDGEDKMLGGVISGICRYFGATDSLPWRILFLLACIFSYSGLFWVYLILWALVPEARTAEERLLMKGSPINTSTLNQEIINGINKARDTIANPENRSTARGCVTGLLNVLILLFKIFFVLLLLGMVVAGLVFIIFAALTFLPNASRIIDSPFSDITAISANITTIKWLLLTTCILGFLVFALPLFNIVRGLLNRKNENAETRRKSNYIWWAWVATLIGFFVLLPVTIYNTQEATDTYADVLNTQDGIRLHNGNWDWLNSHNLKLTTLENADRRVVGHDECARNERTVSFLRIKGSNDGDVLPIYQIDHEEEVSPGLYRVEMLYRSFDHKGSLLRISLPETEAPLTDTLHHDAPKSHFADYSWKEAIDRPALSKGVEEADWAEVQARADSLEWRYLSFDFEVKAQGKATVSLVQDESFNQSPKASSHLNIADFRLLKISSDKQKK